MPTCAVGKLLPKFDRAVRRFNELDALREKPKRGGLSPAQLERKLDGAWFRLRGLETQATELLATSDAGVTLQAVLAIAEGVTLHSWCAHELEANIAHKRLQRALASIILSRDLSVLDPETVRFYAGGFQRGPFEFIRKNAERLASAARRPARGSRKAAKKRPRRA